MHSLMNTGRLRLSLYFFLLPKNYFFYNGK
nr:MAG TPA: hypothetical protein [Caudoviricetes sp.]